MKLQESSLASFQGSMQRSTEESIAIQGAMANELGRLAYERDMALVGLGSAYIDAMAVIWGGPVLRAVGEVLGVSGIGAAAAPRAACLFCTLLNPHLDAGAVRLMSPPSRGMLRVIESEEKVLRGTELRLNSTLTPGP